MKKLSIMTMVTFIVLMYIGTMDSELSWVIGDILDIFGAEGPDCVTALLVLSFVITCVIKTIAEDIVTPALEDIKIIFNHCKNKILAKKAEKKVVVK